MFKTLLFGRSKIPPLTNLRSLRYEELSADGLTMGTLIIGKPGSGKTSSLARHLVSRLKAYPDRAIFVLDWSGSITDSIFNLILSEPIDVQQKLLQRVIYDELGNSEFVVPMPEFHSSFGSAEDQVQRVAGNLSKLAPQLVANAPVLGGLAVNEIAPNFFRLLAAIRGEEGESWQITEAKRLLLDLPTLRQAVAKFGGRVPDAKWYLERDFLGDAVTERERELRTFSLRAILGVIEPKPIRARLGYGTPGWTVKNAIDKGALVIINGANLINQRGALHYLFTQAFSLIMEEINRRVPGDPKDKPVAIVLDEVYSLLQIPGMAEDVGMIGPLYRSRKLELYIVIQALWQLADILKEQVWSLGNIWCFSVQNLDEAYKIGQQLFSYNPDIIKVPARSDYGNPIMETDRGQYLRIANWIQNLAKRECIIRRYYSESKLDPYVRHIAQTHEVPFMSYSSVADLKRALLQAHSVKVEEALKVINSRKLTSPAKPASSPQTPPHV